MASLVLESSQVKGLITYQRLIKKAGTRESCRHIEMEQYNLQYRFLKTEITKYKSLTNIKKLINYFKLHIFKIGLSECITTLFLSSSKTKKGSSNKS